MLRYDRDTGSLDTVHISGGGPCVSYGGGITAATDVPGGPVLAGGHLQWNSLKSPPSRSTHNGKRTSD